jgi:CRISPR system Cascade subunit CasA
MSTGSACELSLADALVRAHEIREIFDESPLVTVALHRLLLAILHRNFGPPGRKAWFDLWKRGRWDAKKLSEYFSRWHERFEVFHPERPFYQVPEMDGVSRQPAAILFQEMAAGNNTTLFDHSFEAEQPALPAARAARGLVARQAYSVGFGKSSPFYFSDSPLLRGFTVLVSGENLFQTLALNLVRYDEEHPIARSHGRQDLPAWEQDRPAAPRKEGSRPAGYLDYLTWQSRRIHLYPEEDGAFVRFCQLQQNLKLSEDAPRDPFKCYRKEEKRGWVSLSLREERALWRDSHSLMELSTESHSRPAVFDWVAQIAAEPGADAGAIGPYFSFSAFGLATEIGKAASVTFWRHERLPLPLAYLSDAELLGRIADAIDCAEDAARDLRESVWVLARTLFQPLDSANGQQGRSDDASRLTSELAPLRLYWPALEAPFVELMTALAEIKPARHESRVLEWRKLVRRIARESLQQITRELDTGARALRAVAEGERTFWRKIRERLGPGEEL